VLLNSRIAGDPETRFGEVVSAPLKKADLLAVAHYLIGHLSYSQVPALAKRHKVEAKKDSASAQELPGQASRRV